MAAVEKAKIASLAMLEQAALDRQFNLEKVAAHPDLLQSDAVGNHKGAAEGDHATVVASSTTGAVGVKATEFDEDEHLYEQAWYFLFRALGHLYVFILTYCNNRAERFEDDASSEGINLPLESAIDTESSVGGFGDEFDSDELEDKGPGPEIEVEAVQGDGGMLDDEVEKEYGRGSDTDERMMMDADDDLWEAEDETGRNAGQVAPKNSKAAEVRLWATISDANDSSPLDVSLT